MQSQTLTELIWDQVSGCIKEGFSALRNSLVLRVLELAYIFTLLFGEAILVSHKNHSECVDSYANLILCIAFNNKLLNQLANDLFQIVLRSKVVNGLRHEGKQPSRVLNLWSYESQHVLIVLGENKSVSSDESSYETKQLVLELKSERVI